jgi:very-short-patch-repair endonuclease
MICRRCEKEHNGSFGSGVFCSRACANSRTWTAEINQKRREKALGTVSKFKGVKGLPSRICTEERKEKLRNSWTDERRAEHTLKYKGVQKRSQESKEKMSRLKKEFYLTHPEKHPNRKCAGKKSYWQNVLYNELKTYFPSLQQEYKVNNFFLDIALPEIKINIEYDGVRWHNAEKDKARDEILIEQGWKILRISSTDLNYNKRNNFNMFLTECREFLNQTLTED